MPMHRPAIGCDMPMKRAWARQLLFIEDNSWEWMDSSGHMSGHLENECLCAGEWEDTYLVHHSVYYTSPHIAVVLKVRLSVSLSGCKLSNSFSFKWSQMVLIIFDYFILKFNVQFIRQRAISPTFLKLKIYQDNYRFSAVLRNRDIL
jgi:hypothetical protein